MVETATRTFREAVARFDDSKQLETAVSELQSHGFDRADISLIAQEEGQVAGSQGDMRRAGEDPTTPREAPVEGSDMRQGRVLGTSMAAVIAAFAAAGITVATGGAAALAVGAAVAAGAGAGAVGAAVGAVASGSREGYQEEQIARGGVVIWVRTREVAAEQRAIDILGRCGGRDVHLHEMPATA